MATIAKCALCVVIAFIWCTFIDAVVAQESLTRAIEGPALLPRDQASVFTDETNNEDCTNKEIKCKKQAWWLALNQPAPQNSQKEPALSASELANQISNPRSMLDTPQRYPRAGSQSYPTPAAEPNGDGSTTVYFSPTKPDGGNAGNWIQTDPKKGWFTILRLYSPLEPFFTKEWRPTEIELVG